MSDNQNIQLFNMSNDKGESLDIGSWGGKSQIKVWLAKDERGSKNYVYAPLDAATIYEMGSDATRCLKENNGFSISKMVTRWDKDNKTRVPNFLWTMRKEAGADSAYALTVEFPSDKKSFTFPFKRQYITTTSDNETIEEQSANQVKRFIESLKPQVTVITTPLSKGTNAVDPNKVNPNVGFGAGKKEEDIPF